MGILNGLGWTRKEPTKEKRELSYVNCNASGALPFFGYNNQYSAMNLSAVYRAVELISNSIASLPIKILIHDESGKNEAEKHPLNYVFSDRNTDNLISRFSLMKLLVQSVLLRGNGFALIERHADGTVKALRYLEANDVIINYDKIKNKLYYDVPILKKHIEPKDMIHFLMFSYDGIKGLSVLQNAARSLSIAHSSENAAKAFFDSGMMINGILKVQGPVSQKQREDLRSAWNETYTANGSGVAILQGNMDFQSVQLSAKDSQMLESRQFNVDDIARFFGINPVLLGDLSKTSYSTLEAVQNDFLVHTLQPYITMCENEFDRKLLKQSESNLSIVLETNEILRTDKAAQSSYYSTLINSGVMSINEVRKELGYNGIGEDGDKHIIPFTDVSQNTIENNTNKEGNE